MSAFRFRRFGSRVLALVLGLLFATLAITVQLVSRATLRSAIEHSESNLAVGGRIFDLATQQQIDSLTRAAKILRTDYTLRSLMIQGEDPETTADLLHSFTTRIDASLVALFHPDGRLVATSQLEAPVNVAPLSTLIAQAARRANHEASGFGFLNDTLHVLVVVPFYAPEPNIVRWLGLAFRIDERFASAIKATSRVEVTFVSTADAARPRVLASTLPEASRNLVALEAAANNRTSGRAQTLRLPDDRYVTLFRRQELVDGGAIALVLQRPLNPDLARASELRNYLLVVSLSALAAATLIAFWLARSVSQPVRQLADYTKHVATGDYSRRLALDRADEVGQLATAFNEMSAGLAERDRVRDLLDKNVSPEVAAQLLRDGAALGGEEREVTILFADLRGFTTMSEQLPPRELLALLNRYLDRMSGEIERQGGVIDKFIGDAIMALFGAPVAQSDAADRALSAARGMEAALAALNVELAAEGRPPLALGIGANTARVIAGNIGSQRRLNYSVIGDGVNVASRLQAETRRPEFGANIITSAATLAALRAPARFSFRPLGRVQVKGRAESVEIFAVKNSPNRPALA